LEQFPTKTFCSSGVLSNLRGDLIEVFTCTWIATSWISEAHTLMRPDISPKLV
jgi:hypothetical protein